MLSPDNPALNDIETPALVIDRIALEQNIARMADTVRSHGLGLRPHAKTHKSDQIARLQIAAGAIGVSCATVLEAEALSKAAIDGLLITAPMMGSAKFERLARLHRSRPLMVVVDHIAQVEELSQALKPSDPHLGVLVDIDIGQARTGVTAIANAISLAMAISAAPQMTFAGIQGYAGHSQHIPDPVQRRASAQTAARLLSTYVTALTEAGHEPKIVSGSGTGAHLIDLDGPYTELQAGSYVFMDADYARIVDGAGAGPNFQPSLFVLATVVSVNRPGEVTVDAGTKALAVNGPPPCHIVGAPQGSVYRFTGDEHGTITIPSRQAAPKIGARLLIGATHCDPTVNLHAGYHVVSGDNLTRWPILGRYGVTN